MNVKDFFSIEICAKREELPIIVLPSGVRIAFFNLHGNPSLTERCGKGIAKLLQDRGIEVLITAESKGLQLTHVVARELCHDFYVVARKGKKIYMEEYLEATVKAITGEASHKLYISKEDSQKLKNKKVAIVDDVISSGGSLQGLKELTEKSGGQLTASACVLAEGDSIPNQDILRLADLPLL